MSTTTKLTEIRDRWPAGEALREARVDRGQNLIQGVALLGKLSANNRIYSEQAMRDAGRLYSGARVYIDHPPKSEMRDRQGVRSVRDLAGRVLNARVVGEQVRGDVQVLDVEPTKSLLLALAEDAPELVGFSHRASGRVRVDDQGRQVVEGLDHVFGVELVTDPATVNGLFENVWRREARSRMTTYELIEARLGEIHDRLFGPGWARGR